MSRSLLMTPVRSPVRGRIRPPGSKSLTNRALVVAGLADGNSTVVGVLDSRDTQVMIDSLNRLGIGVRHVAQEQTAEVVGCKGRPPANDADLWLENSGTSIRFLTAVCALGRGRFRLDGNARMRERPIDDLVDALCALGSDVRCEFDNGCPPVVVEANGLGGGRAEISGGVSSQYLSALLMAAPSARSAVELHVPGELVSQPYVEMTRRVMAAFDVNVEVSPPGRFSIVPQVYGATRYEIEPDATAASYFFALAAVTGGEVTVEGLSRDSLQGDLRFVEVLEQMGCEAEYGPLGVTVRGGKLTGIDVDMGDISDTAQTLAVVAALADGPTRIRNITHVRHKETDRIEAVAVELRRVGVGVEEHPEGLTIRPAPIRPATIETYDDHRMAMSFALLGLKHPGIEISDPDCTAKTYPNYFDDLEQICRGTS